ncbi:MAG: hypothetical protein FJ319_08435 [SAR202 cluster bacterium]|nr:hypothetical protein [SAR202 cluster bacterium]
MGPGRVRVVPRILPVMAIGALVLAALACQGGNPASQPTPAASDCTAGAAAVRTVPTPAPEDAARMSRIAFASKRDGNWEIYVMNADGTDQRNLTSNPAFDSYPSWSPDGKRIAFYSERDGNREIYTMNSDGTGQTRITSNGYQDYSPEWSPNGRCIAFVSDRSGETHVWIMNADGTQPVNYSMVLKNSRFPTWAPDSTKLAYMWDRNVNIMTTDSKSGSTIVDKARFFDGFYVGALSWSPDGQTIAMISNHIERNSAVRAVYVSQIDGFRFRNVFEGSTAPQDRPTWSPDSKMLTYAEQTEDGDWDIFVVNRANAQATRLTTAPDIDTFPDWEPVGTVPVYGGQ